jgi:hypothetical protein
MGNHSKDAVLSHLANFADGQFDVGASEVFAVVNRRQFDFVPASEEANTHRSAPTLPYMKRWNLRRGICTIYTDEDPVR